MQFKTLHHRPSLKDTGCMELVSPKNSALKHITLNLLRLAADENYESQEDTQEKVFVVLEGKCSVKVSNSNKVSLNRKSVFDDKPSAVYIPPCEKILIKAKSFLEIAILSAPSNASDLQPKAILPSDVVENLRGKGNWRRHVYNIIDGNFPADRLIIGETINQPGNWSSSPPHKHDQDNPPYESQFEELYFYRTDPVQGFGLQRVYTSDKSMDLAYTVQQNDIVVLPCGYHPVVAAPGYKLYYLWALVGKDRDLNWNEDPNHSWINKEVIDLQ